MWAAQLWREPLWLVCSSFTLTRCRLLKWNEDCTALFRLKPPKGGSVCQGCVFPPLLTGHFIVFVIPCALPIAVLPPHVPSLRAQVTPIFKGKASFCLAFACVLCSFSGNLLTVNYIVFPSVSLLLRSPVDGLLLVFTPPARLPPPHGSVTRPDAVLRLSCLSSVAFAAVAHSNGLSLGFGGLLSW